ncbi:MAG TPA: hypothetical protein VFY93_08985 [Planctomycetota bacterium]|nr:hypothetical protein [Planctomycetota bacterium]
MKLLTILSSAFLFVGCVQDAPGASGQAFGRDVPPAEAPGTEPGTEEPPPPEPPPVAPPPTYVLGIDHIYMPLVPGSTWSYAGDEDGLPRREEVSVLDEPSLILGVMCTAVEEQVFVDGDLVERTTHSYAQDSDGNVWKFAEESIEYEDGVPTASEDSWEAGVDGALPWIVFSAAPQVGDVFLSDGGIDAATVLAVDAMATVPAGVFQACLDVAETNAEDPEDTDRILYAPSVGLVSEVSPTGRIQLVSHGVR